MAFKTDKDVLKMAERDGIYFSDYDKELARRDPDAGLSIYTAKKNYNAATTEADKKHWNQQAEHIRKKYGSYTAGGDGSGFMKDDSYFNHEDPYADRMDAALDKLLGYQEFENPYQEQTDKVIGDLMGYEAFENPYQDKIDSTLDKLTGRDPFSYDAETDPMFQQYRKTYLREGQRANEDTMGNYATMTGGMPSTAAVNAASQAQDYYNAKLADKVPELYKLAYDMYLQDGNDMMNQIHTMRGLGQDALSAWSSNLGLLQGQLSGLRGAREDARADWGANQQLTQNQFDALGQASDRDYNRDFNAWQAAHQVDREAVQDSQWGQQHRLNAQARAQELMNQVLQTGQLPTHETIVRAGFNDADAYKLAEWYKKELALQRESNEMQLAMQRLQYQKARS